MIPPVTARRAAKRWNAARLDKAALRQAIENAPYPADLTLYNSRESVEALIDENMRLIAVWCDASMPRKAVRPSCKPAYWWTAEIGELRAECLRQRRKATRSRHRDATAEALYKTASKALPK